MTVELSQQREIGWIPYWNLLPLRRELLRRMPDLRLRAGAPTQVNRWLGQGEVCVAPCSSICLIRGENHGIAAPMGVVVDGPVESVVLAYREPLAGVIREVEARHRAVSVLFRQLRNVYGNDGRTLAKALWQRRNEIPRIPIKPPPLKVTTASATSAMLSRMFYRLWFGDQAFEDQCSEEQGVPRHDRREPLELLIGDEALEKRSSYHGFLDLGRLWQEFCGLPLVFAVWQSLEPLNPDLRAQFLECASLAQARMRVDPSSYLPDTVVSDADGYEIDLRRYWQSIEYQLGGREIEGLVLFLCMAGYMQTAGLADSALVKIMRWQSQNL